MTEVLALKDVHKVYRISRPPRVVLDEVSFTISDGEFVAIMGPSGSGKSTLLHVLGGLEPPDTGEIKVRGEDIYAMDDETRSRFRLQHIGFVFQFFNLIPSLTAAENIALPLRLRDASGSGERLGRTAIMERVSVLMELLNLRGLQGHSPEDTSGGEQQRIAIARALASAPSLLLADEPTGNLDFTTGHEVMALLAKLCRQQNQTTVLVTHDARVAANADRILVMRDGKIIDEIKTKSKAGGEPDVESLVSQLRKHDL